MAYLTTQELYHKPDCSCNLFKMPNVKGAAVRRYVSPDELEEEGYEPCPVSFPERTDE